MDRPKCYEKLQTIWKPNLFELKQEQEDVNDRSIVS